MNQPAGERPSPPDSLLAPQEFGLNIILQAVLPVGKPVIVLRRWLPDCLPAPITKNSKLRIEN